MNCVRAWSVSTLINIQFGKSNYEYQRTSSQPLKNPLPRAGPLLSCCKEQRHSDDQGQCEATANIRFRYFNAEFFASIRKAKTPPRRKPATRAIELIRTRLGLEGTLGKLGVIASRNC